VHLELSLARQLAAADQQAEPKRLRDSRRDGRLN
jgi:hypothetical protein